jgi:pyruvate dehydrogenase E1 component alpha subunit
MPRKPVAKFVVDHLQILDEKGQVDAKLDPGLPAERLLEMYRWMRLARELDERMLKLQRQGRLGTFPPNTGHEAVSVPIAMAMGPKDWFVGAFRETGGRLVRGEPLTSPLFYYNGWEEGNILPDPALRITPISVVIGCQIPQAAGLAYAGRYNGEDNATVCFIGDGGTSEGDFHEGLNFAAVWKAPSSTSCRTTSGPSPFRARRRLPAARWPRRRSPSTSPACRSTATTRWRCGWPSTRRWTTRARARDRT